MTPPFIEWEDPAIVSRSDEHETFAVADAIAELNGHDRSSWAWLAKYRISLHIFYRRTRHPGLVRENGTTKASLAS